MKALGTQWPCRDVVEGFPAKLGGWTFSSDATAMIGRNDIDELDGVEPIEPRRGADAQFILDADVTRSTTAEHVGTAVGPAEGQVRVDCDRCEGSGREPGSSRLCDCECCDCDECGGDGHFMNAASTRPIKVAQRDGVCVYYDANLIASALANVAAEGAARFDVAGQHQMLVIRGDAWVVGVMPMRPRDDQPVAVAALEVG